LAQEDSPLTPFATKTASYFLPLTTEVTASEDGSVSINAGKEEGLIGGMRLTVFRKGEDFLHPVTREVIGQIEKQIGMIEVSQVYEDNSLCRIIQGLPEKGDIARISSSKKRLFFYQDKSVDYYLGDAYYKELKKTGAFEMIDAPIEAMDRDELLTMAKTERTDITLHLSAAPPRDTAVLEQTLLWNDGSVLSRDTLGVPFQFLNELHAGLEFLEGDKQEPLLIFDFPYEVGLLQAGDIDADGTTDLVLSTGKELYVYRYDASLSFLHKVDTNSFETIVWLDLHDADGDGGDEVFITAASVKSEDEFAWTDDSAVTPKHVHERVRSYVYKFVDNQLKRLWKTSGFLRIFEGEIIYQKYSNVDGFTGPVRMVHYNGDFQIGDIFTDISDFNIYNFTVIHTDNDQDLFIFMNGENHLNLVDMEGLPYWKSPENFGGFTRKYDNKSPTVMVDTGKWNVNDRLVKRNDKILVVKRDPLVKRAKKIGYKNSQILSYWYNDRGMRSSVLIDSIKGELLDFSVFDDKVAILSRPIMGVRAGNILKGKNPFIRLLQIYSLRGR
jgi:hypothetical protein